MPLLFQAIVIHTAFELHHHLLEVNVVYVNNYFNRHWWIQISNEIVLDVVVCTWMFGVWIVQTCFHIAPYSMFYEQECTSAQYLFV